MFDYTQPNSVKLELVEWARSWKSTRKLDYSCGGIVHLIYYSKKCRDDENTETNRKLVCVASNESTLEKRNRVRSLAIVIVLAISFLGLLSQSVGEATTTVTASATYNSGGYGGQLSSRQLSSRPFLSWLVL